MTPAALRVLVVDDEPLARRGLRQHLGRHPDALIREARNGQEALAALAEQPHDLVFLDVQMPELDGFEVVRRVGIEHMPPVVFVTAYEVHAVRAFEAQAVDYLVKPVSDDRFDNAMRRARRMIAVAAIEAASQSLSAASAVSAPRPTPPTSLPEPTPPAVASRIVAATASGDATFDVAEIDWIGAEDYYAAVYVRGRQCLLRESLASFEARLDPNKFTRVHRSAIVNLARVRELSSTPDEMSVILDDGTRLPVSRRRRLQLVSLLRARAS